MKKLFISLIAVAFSLSAMAASTAAARIKLVGSNTTYAVSTLFLNEDDARNSSYESGYDAESMMSQSNPFSVLIYAYVGEHPCEFVATDNLDGQEITFTTNMIDADYTLQFTNVSGRTLNLYDRLLDVTTPIVEGESYNFSVDGSLVGQHAVSGRFYINVNADYFAYTLTTNADGWASFSWDADLEAVESGLSIYRGDYNDNTANPEIELFELNYVPANAGVFVHGAANTTYHFNAYSGIGVGGLTNDIVACVAATPVSTFGTDAIYALRYANGATALYQYVGTADIPAHKAVLPIAGLTPSSAPKRISMRINGTQAVDNVEAIAPAEKFVENGQVLIRRGEAVYNLQGQMVK